MAPAVTMDLKLPSLQDLHVVVVGDVMLDRYWHGDAERVSQEAPVPVVNVTREEARPGGAANVALNIVSLGARCTLIGVVGQDEAGAELARVLTAAGVSCRFMQVQDQPTTVKLRIISQRQQLIRTDFEADDAEADLTALVKEALASADALILEDYDKGAVSKPEQMIAAAHAADVPVLVDPKSKPLERYRGAAVVKPNAEEFRKLVGQWRDEKTLSTLATGACREFGIDGLVVTQGNRGLGVATTDEYRHVPANEVEVYDVTGAGDTTAALLAVGTALGWSLIRSAQLANLAASLVVAKFGTATVSGPELAYAVARLQASDRGVVTRIELQDAVARARDAGERVVFTNGCFDILHAGHVTYLEEARTLGDRLIVAVNDDASVTRLKGEGRPVNRVERRMRVLAGLAAVDWVVAFDEDTPESLLRLLQPDVLVKGGDYGPEEVVGHELVADYGGAVHVLSLVEDCSTTDIVERIRG